MADARSKESEPFPKPGRVNEACREWGIREDGALAYRLQDQEISEHYQGNRLRNTVVREDFPRALDEQLREQKLAEQAAAVYHQMLAEQEEIDKIYAKKVADRLEQEERIKRHLVATQDEHAARQYLTQENFNNGGILLHQHTPQKGIRRQAPPMPPPQNGSPKPPNFPQPNPIPQDNYLYTEPYNSEPRPTEAIVNEFDRIDIIEDDPNEKELQEKKDLELARQLQQEEDTSEESQMIRDRLLAIEAQDKELAKLLQEKERQKVKRAREKAKQKALAKKQLEQQHHQQLQEPNSLQLMPDDSYSNPADLLPSPLATTRSYIPPQIPPKHVPHYENQASLEEDLNYSLPVDTTPTSSSKNFDTTLSPTSTKNFQSHNVKQHYSPQKTYMQDVGLPVVGESSPGKNEPPTRPTQLDLKGPLNRPHKPKYNHDSETSPSQHMNIAMVIDPTYNRRSQHLSPGYDTTSSTVTTSTSGSSPGMLPALDLSELEEEASPVPPYMPIQGQRRTASLEKKPKKKAKDGCKQQ